MAIFDEVPYTNFHDKNLDGMCKKISENREKIEELEKRIPEVGKAYIIDEMNINTSGEITFVDADRQFGEPFITTTLAKGKLEMTDDNSAKLLTIGVGYVGIKDSMGNTQFQGGGLVNQTSNLAERRITMPQEVQNQNRFEFYSNAGVPTLTGAGGALCYLYTDSRNSNEIMTYGAVSDMVDGLVHKGGEILDGVYTFESTPRCVNVPVRDDELVNKAYVDSHGGGGGGSNVVVSPVLTEGIRTAVITVDGVSTPIYAPAEGGGGSVVTYNRVAQTGRVLGTITIDGEATNITNGIGDDELGDKVTVYQTLRDGVQIADIDVNGTSHPIYAPSASAPRKAVFSVVDDQTAEEFANITIYPDSGYGVLSYPANGNPVLMPGEEDMLRAGLNRPCTWYGSSLVPNMDGWLIISNGYSHDSAYKEYSYKIHFVDGVKVEEKVVHTFGTVDTIQMAGITDTANMGAFSAVFIKD